MTIKQALPVLIAVALLLLFPAPTHSHNEAGLRLSGIKLEQPVEALKMAQVGHLELAGLHFAPMGTYPNAFPSGQCTHGAASMKGNVSWTGNASDWDDQARARGITVSDTPLVGAIAQTDRGGYGHVAIDVGVAPDGNPLITEMNYDYNGSVRTREAQPGEFRYIYLN